MQHHVFITGCGSGFGRRLTLRLLELGHVVVATDPSQAALDALPKTPSLHTYVLDVSDLAAVARVAQQVLAELPIDTVVNNGGYALFGTIEEANLEKVRKLFEVNVLGTAAVCQAFLPALRSRPGSLVVQLSSVAGQTVFTESGYYAATKHAVEAMTEALWQECCTLGVRCRLIQPGSFDTQFLPTAQAVSDPAPADSAYAALRDTWMSSKVAVLEAPQDPQLVVDAIVAQLDDPRGFARVPVGADARRMLGLREHLGSDVYSRLAADRVGFSGPHHADAVQPNGPRSAAVRAAQHADHWEE